MPKYRTSMGSVMFKVGLHTVKNLQQKIKQVHKDSFVTEKYVCNRKCKTFWKVGEVFSQ